MLITHQTTTFFWRTSILKTFMHSRWWPHIPLTTSIVVHTFHAFIMIRHPWRRTTHIIGTSIVVHTFHTLIMIRHPWWRTTHIIGASIVVHTFHALHITLRTRWHTTTHCHLCITLPHKQQHYCC